MNQLVGYVIYPDNLPETLIQFYQQSQTDFFQPIKMLDKHAVMQLNPALLFDIEKFNQQYNRNAFPDEIAQTLAHFQCWKAIAENTTLTDNDYAVIAESSIKLTPNFRAILDFYIEKYPYDIIKLQRQKKSENIDELKLNDGGLEKVGALIYGVSDQLDGYGASFYLIRKSVAKQLVNQYSKEKPFWRCDDFSLFYNYQKIVELKYYLSHIPQLIKTKLSDPLFSIIIPAYNVDRYLAQCLDSVLAQDFNNYEIILVNDGSNDYTAEIGFEYAQHYSHINFISQRNQGLSAARNSAIKQAKGKYLILLDSDDYWNGQNILSELSKLINNENYPDLIINTHSTLMMRENNKIYEINNLKNSENLLLTGNFKKDYNLLIKNNIFVGFAWTKIIKRELVIDNQLFFPEGKNFEDVKWSFEIAPYINTYCLFKPFFYIYRVGRANSITEYVRKENLLDLFYAVNSNLQLAEKNKTIYPEMYQGMLYSAKESYEYILKCYEKLNAEDKAAINDEFDVFQKLTLPMLKNYIS